MSNFVIILGDSGSGKSTSIKTLNPHETVILNVLGKRLPFQGSPKSYNAHNKNIYAISNWQDIITYIQGISDTRPEVKNIVIDDFTYVMRTEYFDRSKESGYGKYSDLADHFRKIIAACNVLRDDLNVFGMLHSEPIENEGAITGYKSATVGKLLDKMYSPEQSSSIVLFAKPRFNDNGIPTFGFYTHKIKVDGIELPSKTPDGMFADDFIPNDLQLVVDTMNKYYNE